MDFLRSVVEWFGTGSVAIQIYSDTGYLWTRMETAPAMAQEIHNRLVAWILKNEEKK